MWLLVGERRLREGYWTTRGADLRVMPDANRAEYTSAVFTST
jgi:hypothetical protein